MASGDDQDSAIDVDNYCKLPSLCKLIAEPEAHPDFAKVIASFTPHAKIKESLPSNNSSSSGGQLLPSISMLFPIWRPSIQTHRRQQSIHSSPSTTPRSKSKSQSSTSSSLSSQQNIKKPTFSKKRSLKQDSHIMASTPRPAKLYAVSDYKISESHFYTSAAPRGYITVYSYFIGPHCIIIDAQTSLVSLTNICMALDRPEILSKIAQSKEFTPYLEKITSSQSSVEYIWAPLSIAREISRRIAWNLRFDLVPIFGFQFPTQCLAPNDPHFEDLSLLTSTRRANSRLAESSFAKSNMVTTSGPSQHRASTGSLNVRPGSVPLENLHQTRHRSETMSTNTSSSSVTLHSTPPTSTSTSPVQSRLWDRSAVYDTQGKLVYGKQDSIDTLQNSIQPLSLRKYP